RLEQRGEPRVDPIEEPRLANGRAHAAPDPLVALDDGTRGDHEPAARLRALEREAAAREVLVALAEPRAEGPGVDGQGEVLVFVDAADVDLERLPGAEALGRLLGKRRGIAGPRAGLRGEEARGLVLAVTVARRALEARDDDERAEEPDRPHHVAEHVLLAPLLEGLVQPLRVAVVDDGGEVLLVEPVVAA